MAYDRDQATLLGAQSRGHRRSPSWGDHEGSTVIGPTFPAVLDRTRRGDEAAFTTIWRAFHPGLIRYLRIVTGSAAEDVASETWAAVVTSIDRFDGDETAFRAWLFTVARRRAIDYFRREARRPAVPVDPATLGTTPAASTGVDPGQAAIDTIATESALAFIAQLPAEQAEAVVLRAIAGLDVADVAAIMQKRPGTVRVLAHRGLRTLAQWLAEEQRVVTP
jgi:RNA polymerase sigma-70 factor (ECF subfamily)